VFEEPVRACHVAATGTDLPSIEAEPTRLG
jgi:hypothetical protein